jgi:hypothetical protein
MFLFVRWEKAHRAGKGTGLLNHVDRTARQHHPRHVRSSISAVFVADEHSAIRVKRHAVIPRTRGFWSVQI